MSNLLAKAAEKQDLDRIDALLDAGADIEWQHKGTGRTPLLSAVIAGKADSVVRLLDRGANIQHACTALGYTALGWAANAGDTKIGHMLIARGASLDAASPELRRTPLMVAAQGGHLPMVELLLAGGADVARVDFEGRNALALAEECGHAAVVQRLQAAGAQRPPALEEAPALAWPEPAADGDPAAVVRGYMLACHAWETRGYRDAKGGGDLLGSAAFQQERADILAAWCTDRKRVYSTGMAVGNPPVHVPEDLLAATSQPTASKAEVLVRDHPQKSRALRYERLFVLKRVAGQWRIDVLKKRLFRIEAWSSAIL
ncbi:ankyrin repeat domain-containing protein [Stenotrophomonas sp. SMYL11]|uniref:ankyrin repeat domain-containing protein n=1 Tax=Stenotrophomonas sp. SMYL11 TaxID=3076042 RepID=UPI002E798B0F|nr:ankyrin repeat domain-containing protein [Stenotrophomonas sp. SMYL11]